MHDDQQTLIDAYLDDELSPGQRQTVDAHLVECEACRRTLEELRHVVAHAANLTDSAPVSDLWPGIEARIAPGSTRARVSPFRRAISARLSFTIPQVAAAGLALMVLSGGLVWMARSRTKPSTPCYFVNLWKLSCSNAKVNCLFGKSRCPPNWDPTT